jgi:RND family efflux transporter MFP subunit
MISQTRFLGPAPRGLLLVLAAAALPIAFPAPSFAQPSAAQPIAVHVAQPTRHDFARVSSQPGTAEAFYEADLGAKVSGYVSELLVDVGAQVKRGQVLARIAVPELDAERKAAAAQVTALRSERGRIATLVERKSMTEKALSEAEERLDAASARVAEIDARLAYTSIEAPFDGIVTWRAIDPGDMVYEASSPKGSGQPLLRVAKTDVIRVKTYVPERDAVAVNVGDPVTTVFEALPGMRFDGAVARLAGALDPATRTMLVEVDLPNADGRIRPGLYGETRITLEEHGGALALPSAAIRVAPGGGGPDSARPYVYVVGNESSVRRVELETGLTDGKWIEVRDGVAENARVVQDANIALSDGDTVRVIAP